MKTKRNLIQACLLGAILLQALNSGAQPVTKIAAGYNHSLFLKSDGSLWAMGDNKDLFGNNCGQLGDGTYNNTNLPELIVISNVTAIAAGYYHSLFIKSDGSLWAMGDNAYGQLGDGTYNNTNLPELIVASNVTAVAAGAYFSLFLKGDGSLWAMGDNYYGQLGDGTTNNDNGNYNTNRPEQIVASNVTAIAAGQVHSLFLKSDGSLWVMGFNGNGRLGDGGIESSINFPEQIVASNVTAIATESGASYNLFLKGDGSLWGMGDNRLGQLGDGTNIDASRPEQIVASNVTAIATGAAHSLFLKNDGSLWGMGWNDYWGQLGDGTYNDTNLPEMIVAGGVKTISAGEQHTLFVRNDGSLWGMGGNNFGQLGDGTTIFKTNLPELIVAGPPGYNQIAVQLLSGGNVGLSYIGMAGTNYELDRSFSLSPADWVPLVTNPAGAGGVLLLTNVPNKATNNFWRIRSVP